MRGRADNLRLSNLELAEFKSEPTRSHPDKQNEQLWNVLVRSDGPLLNEGSLAVS